jgi:hypothetical protein
MPNIKIENSIYRMSSEIKESYYDIFSNVEYNDIYMKSRSDNIKLSDYNHRFNRIYWYGFGYFILEYLSMHYKSSLPTDTIIHENIIPVYRELCNIDKQEYNIKRKSLFDTIRSHLIKETTNIIAGRLMYKIGEINGTERKYRNELVIFTQEEIEDFFPYLKDKYWLNETTKLRISNGEIELESNNVHSLSTVFAMYNNILADINIKELIGDKPNKRNKAKYILFATLFTIILMLSGCIVYLIFIIGW